MPENNQVNLFSRRKITILKAIHNTAAQVRREVPPVFAPKNYNFESNSQQIVINNLIHDPVFAPKNYNFESNSQLFEKSAVANRPVFAPKNYNFESNSQQEYIAQVAQNACFRAEKLQF